MLLVAIITKIVIWSTIYYAYEEIFFHDSYFKLFFSDNEFVFPNRKPGKQQSCQG